MADCPHEHALWCQLRIHWILRFGTNFFLIVDNFPPPIDKNLVFNVNWESESFKTVKSEKWSNDTNVHNNRKTLFRSILNTKQLQKWPRSHCIHFFVTFNTSLCTLQACWNHFFILTRIPVLKFFILIKENRSCDNAKINWEIWRSLATEDQCEGNFRSVQ